MQKYPENTSASHHLPQTCRGCDAGCGLLTTTKSCPGFCGLLVVVKGLLQLVGWGGHCVAKYVPSHSVLSVQDEDSGGHQGWCACADFSGPMWSQIWSFGGGFNVEKMAPSCRLHVRYASHRDNGWFLLPSLQTTQLSLS